MDVSVWQCFSGSSLSWSQAPPQYSARTPVANSHLHVLYRPRVPPSSPVVFDVHLLYIPGIQQTLLSDSFVIRLACASLLLTCGRSVL